MLTGFLFLLQLLFQTPNTLGIWLNCIPTLLIQKGGPEMIKNMSVATQSRNVRVKDGTGTCWTPEFKCFIVLAPSVWSAGTVQGKRFYLLKNIWPPVITPPHSSNFGSTWIARIPQHVGIQPVHPTPSVLQWPPIYGLPSSSLRRLQIACTRSQTAHKRQPTNGGDRPLSSWTALWRHVCKESKGRLTEGCSLLVYQHTCWKCTICSPTS